MKRTIDSCKMFLDYVLSWVRFDFLVNNELQPVYSGFVRALKVNDHP